MPCILRSAHNSPYFSQRNALNATLIRRNSGDGSAAPALIIILAAIGASLAISILWCCLKTYTTVPYGRHLEGVKRPARHAKSFQAPCRRAVRVRELDQASDKQSSRHHANSAHVNAPMRARAPPPLALPSPPRSSVRWELPSPPSTPPRRPNRPPPPQAQAWRATPPTAATISTAPTARAPPPPARPLTRAPPFIGSDESYHTAPEVVTWHSSNTGGGSHAAPAVPRRAAHDLKAKQQQRVAEWVDEQAPAGAPEEFQVEVVVPDAVASNRGQERRQGRKRVRFESPERGRYYWRRVVR